MTRSARKHVAPKNRWRRWLRVTVLATMVGAVVGGAVLTWAWYRYVVEDPGEQLSREAILAIIAQESPVYYRDGTTPIGVFFAREHRQYVPIDEIPQAWQDAIVAAEDRRFFEHHGVDPLGIARAMVRNVQAGRLVAGGSTLTQQAAKNLYYRPDRSLRSKWTELVNALRLEAHYTKPEILEFYANQFHVSANGRGLGIAARYFFDKEPAQLSTLECAFIAGMVKGPANYNPFIGRTEARRQAARARARARTRYVLDRMLEDGSLDARTHDELVEQEVPFKRGTFRYDSSVLVDEVAARLEQAPFPTIFAQLGIDNPSTAGIQVVTTLDAGAEREATYALWHHLSGAGSVIEGVDDFKLSGSPSLRDDPAAPLQVHEFYTARVLASEPGERASVSLDLGGEGCVVDREGLERVATILAQAVKGDRWKKAGQADVDRLVGALPPGAAVWASVRAPGRCDLEHRPALQGAVMVLEDGQIRAFVGGNTNRNFNRAVTARRQLGSTWKPLVYDAALQLGWSPADVLDNRANVFHFEGTWYYPRADHHSVDQVSLEWAGTRSENLASIWLLAHLVDRLDPDQLARLAEQVDLAPREDESRMDFIRRIRDDFGVIATAERRPEAAFTAARAEVVGTLDGDEALELRSLYYGRGAQAEEARLRKSKPGKRRAGKLRAVHANFLRVEALTERCVTQAATLRALGEAGVAAKEPAGFGLFRKAPPPAPAVPGAAEFDALSVRPWRGVLQLGCGEVDDNWAPVGEHLLAALADGVAVPLGTDDEMWVDGRLRVSTVHAVRRAMSRQLLVLQESDPYDLQSLLLHPDYRTLLSLRYVAGLANALGVRSELPPVLSMPLGAVDISLEEAATMYQGMQRGQRWSFPGRVYGPGAVAGLRSSDPVPSPGASTLLISEIRDRDGHVIYRALPESRQVVSPEVGREVGGILRNVVLHGTGRRALGAVQLQGRPVPVAGKTGTTNGYKNAAFCGFVPRAGEQGWVWGDGYTVATYVGYDDNRPMRRGNVRLQGASGALPVWIQTARGLAEAGLLGEAAPEADEWQVEDGFVTVSVHGDGGLVGTGEGDEEPSGEPSGDIVIQGALDGDGALEPTRRFAPFRVEGLPDPADLEPPVVDPVDSGLIPGELVPRLGPSSDPSP